MKKSITIFLSVITLALLCFGIYSCDKDGSANNVAPSTNSGIGGSLARFIMAGNYLYVVDRQNLNTFSLTNPAQPSGISTIPIGFDIETIFAWKDKLFIGSQSAMYIYSIADPAIPRYLGEAGHVRACDPVVANDSIAYVTVRSGSTCGGTVNALFVYDYKNPMNPKQKMEIPMANPQGLGLLDTTLFVCDREEGLVVYALENNYYNPHAVATITGETFYDCIPYGDILICLIEGGTALYDISDRANIKQVAKITN
jgi:hypothetical protein